MPAGEFLDTNVVIYAFSRDAAKKAIALELLAGTPTISTQVINETLAVLHRKQLLPLERLATAIDDMIAFCRVVQLGTETIRRALNLMQRYRFSYYDALIVASAIEAGCDTLYTEDLQHGQLLENRLTVINPFRLKSG